MDIVKLNAQPRSETGKGAARALRRTGRIPAVLYGSGIDTQPLSVSVQALERMFNSPKFTRGLINLVVEKGGKSQRTVMIKEFQHDPVKEHYLHIDFYEIKMDQKISTMVPVTTTGTSEGVEEGGILQIIRRELEVYCLPANIPEQIEIDISNLDVGDSVHVSEIPLAEGVEIPYDVDFTILTVVSPKMEAPEEEGEEEELEEGEEGEGAGGEESESAEE
ncbi:MAG: 50S ribosomal protein L25/general stress protein Ctc [Desulfobacteraceae bacterium]|nr:50S ribosomal protein L25/general stress protein Ctc [Desulfobacteraceae bacterium]